MQDQTTLPTALLAAAIRRQVFEHTMRHNGGYLSQACSAAEILATMYGEVLQLGPSIAPAVPRPFAGTPSAANPHSFTGAGYHGAFEADKDRFFISPAHYALVVYSALVVLGRLAPEGLEQFNRDGSSVEMIGAEHSPGMEVTTGSLAQGLSMAAGLAWARRRRGESGRVWVFMSDGEFQEGQTWECFAALKHHHIENLRVIVDVNAQQCDGAMKEVLDLGDLAQRLRAFGADVHSVDGHDIEAIKLAAREPATGRPLVILAQTSPYQGMDFLQRRFPRLHYVRFKSEQERIELQAAIDAQLTRTEAGLRQARQELAHG
jgi:transketolase